MSTFSDQYFRDLAPRERRYDVRVSDQLVFCVFPNGVKAWVYLYDADGHVRRRTIGLFPDMGYEAALRALDPNRRIAALEASEQRRDRSSPNRLDVILERVREKVTLRDVIAAGGTAVVAFTAFVLIGGRDESPSGPPTATVPATNAQRDVAETMEPPTPAAAGPAELAATGDSRRTAGAGPIVDPGQSGIAGAPAPDATSTMAESAVPGAATGAAATDDALPAGAVVDAAPPEADLDPSGREEVGAGSVAGAGSDAPPTDPGPADPGPADPGPTDPGPTTATAEPPADAGGAGIETGSIADDAPAADPDEPPAFAGDRIPADGPPENGPEPAVPDEAPGDETLTADADEPAAGSGVVAREKDPGLTLAEAAAPATLGPVENASAPPPGESAPGESAPGESAPGESAPGESTIAEPEEPGSAETASLEPGETATVEAAEIAVEPPGETAAAENPAAPSAAGTPVVDEDAGVPTENRAPVSTAAGYVERALLAGRIVGGEPVEPLPPSFAPAPDGSRTVCFFMEVDEDAGAVIVHRWIRDGVIAAEIPLEAAEDPQGRIFSSRRVGADDIGDWRIDALSADGQLIASTSFTVVAPADATARLADEQPAE